MNKSLVFTTRKFGLRQRLLIGTVLILVVAQSLIHWSHRSDSFALSQSLSQETARLAEKNLRFSFEQMKDAHALALQSLVKDVALKGFLTSNDEPRIQELMTLKQRGLKLSRLWLFDAALVPKLPASVKTWPRLDVAVKGSLNGDSATQMQVNEAGLALVAAAPLLDDTGKVLGVLVAERTLDDAVLARLGDQNIQLALIKRQVGAGVVALANAMPNPLDGDALAALSQALDSSPNGGSGQVQVKSGNILSLARKISS
jgi:hypothetical protein